MALLLAAVALPLSVEEAEVAVAPQPQHPSHQLPQRQQHPQQSGSTPYQEPAPSAQQQLLYSFPWLPALRPVWSEGWDAQTAAVFACWCLDSCAPLVSACP